MTLETKEFLTYIFGRLASDDHLFITYPRGKTEEKEKVGTQHSPGFFNMDEDLDGGSVIEIGPKKWKKICIQKNDKEHRWVHLPAVRTIKNIYLNAQFRRQGIFRCIVDWLLTHGKCSAICIENVQHMGFHKALCARMSSSTLGVWHNQQIPLLIRGYSQIEQERWFLEKGLAPGWTFAKLA